MRFLLLLFLFGCSHGGSSSTATGPLDSTLLTLSSSKISATAITATSIALSWVKPTDPNYAQSSLTYSVYQSTANPTTATFKTSAQVTAGTLVGTGQDISSMVVSGLSSGSAYYFNVIATDPAGATLTYTPYGDFFETNLALYYPFDNGDADISPSGNNGLSTNSPTFVADRFGNSTSAKRFLATSSQKLTSTSNISLGTSSRSVSFWVYADATPGVSVFGIGAGATTAGNTFGFYQSSGNWVLWCYAGCDVNTATAFSSSWEHWVIVYDQPSNKFIAYKNGVPALTATAPGGAAAVSTLTGPFTLGTGSTTANNDQNGFFSGAIDDIRLYTKTLTQSEVTNLYAVTRP